MRAPRASLVALAAAALAIGAGACGSSSAPSATLAGRTYVSESVQEQGADRPLVAGTVIRFVFGHDGNMTLTAGCNTMAGPFSAGGHTLRAPELASTAIGCPAELVAQDAWLSGLVTNGLAYQTDGDRLRLTAGTTVIRLRRA